MYRENPEEIYVGNESGSNLRKRFKSKVNRASVLRETLKRGFQTTMNTMFKNDYATSTYEKMEWRKVVAQWTKYSMLVMVLVIVFVLFPIARSFTNAVFNDRVKDSNMQSVVGKIHGVHIPDSQNGMGPEWHDNVKETRPDDVINHRYDDIAFSILLTESTFFAGTSVHQSVMTFLRQVSYLQVCNERMASTFMGGKLSHVTPFFLKGPELPRLQRYTDAFTSIYQNYPTRDWYLQLDEGIINLTRNIHIFGKHSSIFEWIQQK